MARGEKDFEELLVAKGEVNGFTWKRFGKIVFNFRSDLAWCD